MFWNSTSGFGAASGMGHGTRGCSAAPMASSLRGRLLLLRFATCTLGTRGGLPWTMIATRGCFLPSRRHLPICRALAARAHFLSLLASVLHAASLVTPGPKSDTAASASCSTACTALPQHYTCGCSRDLHRCAPAGLSTLHRCEGGQHCSRQQTTKRWPRRSATRRAARPNQQPKQATPSTPSVIRGSVPSRSIIGRKERCAMWDEVGPRATSGDDGVY